MPSQTFRVTADAPNGWEFNGEYRSITMGEHFVNHRGEVECWTAPIPSPGVHLRLTRAWQPPAWLPIENWLYWNNERWVVTNRPPRLHATEGFARNAAGSVSVPIETLAAINGQTWTPPPTRTTLAYQL